MAGNRNVADALKAHLEELMARLDIPGAYEGRDWVSHDGELRVTAYGTWNWGARGRGDDLLAFVAAKQEKHVNGARAWAERWLAERDPNYRAARTPRARKNAIYHDVPALEVERKLRETYPQLAAPDLWRHWGIVDPWRVVAVYEYLDATGRLVVLAARVQHTDPTVPKMFAHVAHFPGTEEVLQGYHRVAGHRQLNEHLPLFNLPALLARPEAPVLVVEGEKTALTAAHDFPTYVATTWLGGANRVGATDWSVLQQRKVVLWADNDEPGRAAMLKVRQRLRRYTPWLGLVPVEQLRLPPAWDLADPYQDGFTLALASHELEKALGVPPWLAEMNEKYLIANREGAAVIYHRVEQVGPPPFYRSFRRWRPTAVEDLHLLYANHITIGEDRRGNLVNMPYSQAWLQHVDRAEATRVYFSSKDDELATQALNLYVPTEPRPDPSGPARPWKFLKFVYHVICKRRPREFKVLMNMLAELVQFPERPWGRALVLQGEKGVGKTKFGEFVCDLMPAHAVIHTNYEHAMTKFNEWLDGCVVVFFDEALYAGDRKHESYLKNLITGNTVRVERKREDQRAITNMSHVILAGNPERLINATNDERRYVVLKVDNEYRGRRDYFGELTRAWLEGERGQLLNLLARLDTEREERKDLPKNVDLIEQILESVDDVRAWVLERCAAGKWRTQARPSEIFEDWVSYMKDRGKLNGHLISYLSFLQRLKAMFGSRYESIFKKRDHEKERWVQLPPASEAVELAVPGAGQVEGKFYLRVLKGGKEDEKDAGKGLL